MATGEELNTAQQQAVDIVDGPVLVVAGAGTGKTRVIVERVQCLIEKGVAPESIMALTFTEKAAAEMLDRLNSAKTGVTLDTVIATFNRFGNELLQAYGAEYGLGRLRLLGDTGQLVFVREHLDSFELEYFAPVSNPEGQLEALVKYTSLLKQQLVTPGQYRTYATRLPANDAAEKLEKQKHQELAHFFDMYVRLCREQQVIDYDDQIYLTIELLQARPNILKELQKRYRYVLVDEFQDTNPMQSALVELLAGDSQNVMVVGDDDQSIYGWRGATLANILDFTNKYPKAKQVALIENYRSSQAILDAAYRLIQHNNPNRLEATNHLDKRLRSNQPAGEPPGVRHFATHESELGWVAEDIQRRLKAGEDPGSIAVLARRTQGVMDMHAALELSDIPHAVAGLTSNVYDQPAVSYLLEVLKAIADPLDDLALFHTLSGPVFRIDVTSLAGLSAAARREHVPFQSALSESDDERLTDALTTLESWREQSGDMTVGALAYSIITDSGWKNDLYERVRTDPNVEAEVQALSKFFATLKEYERVSAVASVQQYMSALPTLRAAGSTFADPTLDISDSLVNILSIHRAKGLEWDTVYIIDCTEGSFPMQSFGGSLKLPDELKQNATAADERLAEERRLMYVAATRARRHLVLTHADRRGSGAVRKPSRFIAELQETHDSTTTVEEPIQTDLELFAPRESSGAVTLPAQLQDSDGNIVLSVSQIEDYLRCPQDFYYQHVLSMPLPPAPHMQYGSLLHGLIEQIHRARRRNAPLPPLPDLLDETLAALPKIGYASARSRERAYEQAKQSITAVYTRFIVEDMPLEAEQSFTYKLPSAPLIIKGRIDAVYKLGDGVEIRDFKTGGSVTTHEKAKQRATSSTQLTLYALAWKGLHDEMPALLTLDFIDTGQVGSVRKQPKSLDTLTTKLEKMVQQLRAGVYEGSADHTFCKHPLGPVT
jgi:DNA helicase-2/ATP-dependent DNA helicase PcrA